MAEEIISRAQARKQGLPYYFSGIPCLNGHISKRVTSDCHCYPCKMEKKQKWAKENPEKKRFQKAQSYLRNREKCLESFKRYRQNNLASFRARNNKRKAIKRFNGGVHTAKDVASIYKAQKGKCAYCREKVGSAYHVDHIIALANGGTNERCNIQVLCAPCNLRKGRKDPIDYARSQGMLL